MTYVREGDCEGADRAFQAIAGYTHSKNMSQVEADTYRQMARYQPDPKNELAFVGKAEAAIREGRNTMQAAIKQELAQILRVRVEVAVKMGNQKMAHSILTRLAAMSQSSNDKLIEAAYHGAAGAVAFSENKYNEAISHLEEDTDNPLSLELLAVAYQKTGDRAGAQRTSETLANLNDVTLEQALVVPSFRGCYKDPSCSGNVKAGDKKAPRHKSPPLVL